MSYLYIGRKVAYYNLAQSVWANPYKLTSEAQRGSTLEQYRLYITDLIEKGAVDLSQLQGEILTCWYHPLPCHGGVLLQLLHEAYPVPTAIQPKLF